MVQWTGWPTPEQVAKAVTDQRPSLIGQPTKVEGTLRLVLPRASSSVAQQSVETSHLAEEDELLGALGAAVVRPDSKGAGRDVTQRDDGAVAAVRAHPDIGLGHPRRRRSGVHDAYSKFGPPTEEKWTLVHPVHSPGMVATPDERLSHEDERNPARSDLIIPPEAETAPACTIRSLRQAGQRRSRVSGRGPLDWAWGTRPFPPRTPALVMARITCRRAAKPRGHPLRQSRHAWQAELFCAERAVSASARRPRRAHRLTPRGPTGRPGRGRGRS